MIRLHKITKYNELSLESFLVSQKDFLRLARAGLVSKVGQWHCLRG